MISVGDLHAHSHCNIIIIRVYSIIEVPNATPRRFIESRNQNVIIINYNNNHYYCIMRIPMHLRHNHNITETVDSLYLEVTIIIIIIMCDQQLTADDDINKFIIPTTHQLWPIALYSRQLLR